MNLLAKRPGMMVSTQSGNALGVENSFPNGIPLSNLLSP